MSQLANARPGRFRVRFGTMSLAIMIVAVAAVLSGSVGCKGERVTRASTPPPPMFRGPAVFHGTVGSMVGIPRADIEPLPVEGYWVVVGLDGTGSSDVPAALRRRLLNELNLKGLGLASKGTLHLTARRLLYGDDTTAVRVEGLIPGGATRGDPFDLLVTALQPLTTSLEGGSLFMDMNLAPGGTLVPFVHPYAKGTGPTYLNPFEDDLSREERMAKSRVAAVLSGGEVTKDRKIRLLLNQADSNRCRIIADRINERFRKNPHHDDKYDTAEAKSEALIEVHVPRRWHGHSDRLLGLIMHCYVQRSFDFEPKQALKLGEVLEQDPARFADRVALAWEALGPNAKPAIGRYYDHPDLAVRFAALQAGAHMQDERTSEHLARLAKIGSSADRLRAAELMVHLPDSLVASHSLRTLLDDSDRNVRIAAYKALSQSGNMEMIHRSVFRTGDRFKFILDIVDAKRPLVFISQTRMPRVVVFNSYTGLKTPAVASLWDNRLMIKAPDAEAAAEVYYLPPGKNEGQTMKMLPFVVHLVNYMARESSHDLKGLNMPYSRIVNALYQLHKAGHIDADIYVESSPLVEMIARYRRETPGEPRPETDQQQPETASIGTADDQADQIVRNDDGN